MGGATRRLVEVPDIVARCREAKQSHCWFAVPLGRIRLPYLHKGKHINNNNNNNNKLPFVG